MHKPRCPFPNVGSKDWNWTYATIGTGLYSSASSPLYVRENLPKQCYTIGHMIGDRWRADVDSSGVGSFKDALRVAETLTRLDWSKSRKAMP